ncbi:hypothetical protein [Labrenzia sp. CE80]|uniref:hypothetical protein n=1 Tax=Labrenzia sp. CE80 TaxID=1788986 RepID=UPI00129AD498|nr:hypothetical protein [Labrenzia sp. CE80]
MKSFFATLFLWVVLAVGADAAPIDSVYTKIKLDECEVQEAPTADEGTFGGSWHCTGYKGMPVYVAEGDLRMFVSFGIGAEGERAAEQTLPNFNTVNETLEWRLRDGQAFATILRWFIDDPEGGKPGNILIVTQIVPGATCQIARIDARANQNANQMARQAADRMAGQYDCRQEPQVLGTPGALN